MSLTLSELNAPKQQTIKSHIRINHQKNESPTKGQTNGGARDRASCSLDSCFYPPLLHTSCFSQTHCTNELIHFPINEVKYHFVRLHFLLGQLLTYTLFPSFHGLFVIFPSIGTKPLSVICIANVFYYCLSFTCTVIFHFYVVKSISLFFPLWFLDILLPFSYFSREVLTAIWKVIWL